MQMAMAADSYPVLTGDYEKAALKHQNSEVVGKNALYGYGVWGNVLKSELGEPKLRSRKLGYCLDSAWPFLSGFG